MLVIRRATDHVILNVIIVQRLSPFATGKNACIHSPTGRVNQLSRMRRSDVRFFFFCVLRRPWRLRLVSILDNLYSRRDLEEFIAKIKTLILLARNPNITLEFSASTLI